MESPKYQQFTSYKVSVMPNDALDILLISVGGGGGVRILLIIYGSCVCFSIVRHSLSHLAVSNSTPPPSTSPIAIKVKSEPVSPPRDHHMAHQQSSASLSITTMNNANSNVLNHPQQHLIMSSRPNSTGGHLTPTPG